MSPEFNLSEDLNSIEFYEGLAQPKPDSTKLIDIVNSVLKGSINNINRGGVLVTKKIKVKHNALRDSVLSFRDLVLYFNSEGIAETEEYNKNIIEIEQMYRPGCFTFVEETKIEEDITVDQFLEQARKEIEENTVQSNIEELTETKEEITQEHTPSGKKGKKEKGK